MEQSRRTDLIPIAKILPWLEKAGLALLLVTGVMMLLEMPSMELLMVSLGTIATVFFLNTHTLPKIEFKEDAPLGFRALFSCLILPKVLWISAAISTIGILFYILRLQGHAEMLLIGGTTLTIGVVSLFALLLSDEKNLRIIYQPVLLRVLPVLIITLYLLVTK